ncbi:hypothetical protein TKK_0004311 [Trichogramma kaykai]|uniref:Fidgetin-like protein 1 n=1 Tax=Trichogramma kaykai TaxID=54128 RepID=A0ABD2XLF1_9HYME
MAGKEFQMSDELKRSYLAAYQTLRFSTENRQVSDAETADVMRRCLFIKYVSCVNTLGDDAALAVFEKDLQKYTDFVDRASGLNNYWKQFESLDVDTDNDPQNWADIPNDINETLKLKTKLPCADDPTEPCKNLPYNDRDIEKMMQLWKNDGTSPRTRKIPAKQNNIHDGGKQQKLNFSNLIKTAQPAVKNNLENNSGPDKKPILPHLRAQTVSGNSNGLGSDKRPILPHLRASSGHFDPKSSGSDKRPILPHLRAPTLSDPNGSGSDRKPLLPHLRASSQSEANSLGSQSRPGSTFPPSSQARWQTSNSKYVNIEQKSHGIKANFSYQRKNDSNSVDRKYERPEVGKPNYSYKQESHYNERKYDKYEDKKSNYGNRNESGPIERREEKKEDSRYSGFKTARTELSIQQAKNNNRGQGYSRQPQPPVNNSRQQPVSNRQQPPVKKSLGGRALNSPFVCPFKENQPKEEEEPPEPTDERLKNIEPKMIELIKNEIMDCGPPIQWDDIAGLDHAKRIIKEIVVFPMLRPDIFTGLRRPPKGILLFGPPGTGKTLIGKCIASQSKSTFFSISASSLTSKWVGEGEKMVRALFAVAQVEQPSVVFIDEIDSLLCQRSETEHESSRRMKTEFLVQLDGAATGDEDRILVIGATNRPYELDEAARRRLVKRLYVPLPELEARAQIVHRLLRSERHDLTEEDIIKIAELAEGYSGADMTNLCKEASMGPIRSIPFDQLEGISKEDVRKVTFVDFQEALDSIRPSVSQKDLAVYIDWDRTYGTASVQSK